MQLSEYKDQLDNISESSIKKERNSTFCNQLNESKFPNSDAISQSFCDIINNFIASSLSMFNKKEFNNYFKQINLIISFLDQFSETEADLNKILPVIFDLNFNYCLIKSINPEQFHIQNVNEVLSLITIISSYAKNFDFFQASSILEIVYNLLKLEDEVIYQNSILIFNKFINSNTTEKFTLDVRFLIERLKNISSNILFSQYCVETYNNIILYIDASNYMNEILYLLNRIILKPISIQAFNEIIRVINNIFEIDPLNFFSIFQSKIIQNFAQILKCKFIKKPVYYQTTIELFLKLVLHLCENLNAKWQEIIIIKVIGIEIIDTFFEKIHDDKILFMIHLILIQYINSRKNYEEILPFIIHIIHIGLANYLIKVFPKQDYKNKKMILIVIHKLLKTRSYEIFSQLLKNEDANYFESFSDFIFDNDDVECQILFLESLIFLVQISAQTGEKHLLSRSQIVNEFVSNCITSEEQKVQFLSHEFYCMINQD